MNVKLQNTPDNIQKFGQSIRFYEDVIDRALDKMAAGAEQGTHNVGTQVFSDL